MFLGEYFHNLDENNRIVIPSKFREHLGKEFVITFGFDKSLIIYPLAEWKKYIKFLENLSYTKKEVRSFIRLVCAKASFLSMDRSGRTKIPDNLLQTADIKEDVVVTGAMDKIEIWNNKNWSKYIDTAQKSFEDNAEKIMEIIDGI